MVIVSLLVPDRDNFPFVNIEELRNTPNVPFSLRNITRTPMDSNLHISPTIFISDPFVIETQAIPGTE